jgi:hypothetical protein
MAQKRRSPSLQPCWPHARGPFRQTPALAPCEALFGLLQSFLCSPVFTALEVLLGQALIELDPEVRGG